MTVVAFDTSSVVLSVSVIWDGKPHEEKLSIHTVLDIGLYHGEYVAGVVRDLLRSADKTVEDIELVACAEGPGSFTGLRIGMATAKGFSAARGIPFRAVPTLDVWAELSAWWRGICVPVIDAKKQRFYAAMYSGGRRLSPDLDADPHQILQHARSLSYPESTGGSGFHHASGSHGASGFHHASESHAGSGAGSTPAGSEAAILITGPDPQRFREASAPEDWTPANSTQPVCADSRGVFSSGALARLAERDFQRWGGSQTGAGPRYVRKSDAEIGRELSGL